MSAPFDLRVMTWNVYLGADVAPVIGAPVSETPARMAEVWRTVQRTDFRVRARAIASEIAASGADVVALQEVYRWSTLPRRPLDEAPSAERLEFDFLALLLDELASLGATYVAAARSLGVNVLLPTTGGPDVRMEDSVVLLLRAGRGAQPLEWEHAMQGRFSKHLDTSLHGEPFAITRGWASVDVRRGDARVRIINTHLEAYGDEVRDTQLDELLRGPAARRGALVLTGDFNCDPDSETWRKLRDAGYRDAWSLKGGDPGFTSCQEPDLRNHESKLYDRIDWILCRELADVRAVACVGTRRGAGDMWPSDHAAVLATVTVAP